MVAEKYEILLRVVGLFVMLGLLAISAYYTYKNARQWVRLFIKSRSSVEDEDDEEEEEEQEEEEEDDEEQENIRRTAKKKKKTVLTKRK